MKVHIYTLPRLRNKVGLLVWGTEWGSAINKNPKTNSTLIFSSFLMCVVLSGVGGAATNTKWTPTEMREGGGRTNMKRETTLSPRHI